MGCGGSTDSTAESTPAPVKPDSSKYSGAEVLAAYDKTGPTCQSIHMESPNVAVWEGKGWIFNEAPPTEPVLVKRIEACMSKAEMTYADVFKVIKDGFLDAMGNYRWAKEKAGSECDIIRLNAMKTRISKELIPLNQKCADAGAGVSFEAAEGASVKNLVGVTASKYHGEVKGMNNQVEYHMVCYVRMIFTDQQGAEGNAPQDAAQPPGQIPAQTPAQKIKDLKELLDMGAITQEAFDEKTTAILASM